MTTRNINWVRYFSRGQHPLLLADSVMLAHKNFSHYFSLPPMHHWARHSGSLFLDQGELSAMLRILRSRVHTGWPERIIKKMQGDMHVFVIACKSLGERPSTHKLYQVFSAMGPAWQTMYFPIFMGDAINVELQTELTKETNEAREEILTLAGKPLYATSQEKYERSLRKLKAGKTSTASIVRNYGWLRTYLLSVKPLTIRDIQNDLNNLSQKVTPNNLVHARLSKRVARLVRLGRLYAWFRDWRLAEVAKGYYYMYPALLKSAKELNLSYDEVCQLYVKELLGGRLNHAALEARLLGYGIEMHRGIIRVATGTAFQSMKKRIAEPLSGKSLQGTCACTGKAIGKVRIVDAYSYHLLKSGDIAVCAELTPLANPYVKGLKAIVTDEGGITSHAAIIAREYKIPCIIGAKGASQILQTGNIIEVDATKGQIKVLKKSRH